jgi:hypothetical protein
MIVPMPEQPDQDNTALGRSFRGQRGRVLLRESVAVSAAGGPAPQSDWRPSDVTPDLEKALPTEALTAARESIAMAYGVLPALLSGATTGQLVKAGQSHLAQWALQPLAELIAEEASEKLGSTVAIDVMGPTQAFDTGAAARSFQMLVTGLAQAKDAGIDPQAALAMLDWSKKEAA